MKKILILSVMLGVLAPLLSAARGAEKVVRATVGGDGVQRVEVVGGSYFFAPNHLIVAAGVPVELTVRKEKGLVPHDIVLKAPEAGIDFRVPLDAKPKVIRFTPKRAGVFPFYCDKRLLFFESHRERGMAGVLEVTAPQSE